MPRVAGRRRKTEYNNEKLHVTLSGALKTEIDNYANEQGVPIAELTRDLWTEKLHGKPKTEPKRIKVLGTVTAGPCDRDFNDFQPRDLTTEELLEWKDEEYAVEIDAEEGNCLIEAGILPGDTLIFAPDIEPARGDVVHVRGADINGNFFYTAKLYDRHQDGIIELHPANPDRRSVKFEDGGAIEVLGVLTGHISRGRLGKRGAAFVAESRRREIEHRLERENGEKQQQRKRA